MIGIPRAFALSLGQLGDPAIRRVLVKSLLVTLAIFVVAGAGLWFATPRLLALAGVESAEAGSLISLVISVIGCWLLFRFVALAVLNFFADDVVRAVEARHYGHAAQVPDVAFTSELSASLRGLLVAVAVNLLALPVAVLLLVTGVGAPLAFWAANAWLLGRELTQMVWLRHRSVSGMRWPLGAGTRFALGGIVAALLAVPFVNLLAPVLGAAMATHLVHGRRQAHA